MENEELSDGDGSNEERIKSEVGNLPWTFGMAFVLALMVFAFTPTSVDRFGEFRFGDIPTILGRAIGSLILPGLFCLVFKRKSRAFWILWLVLGALSLTGLIYSLNHP